MVTLHVMSDSLHTAIAEILAGSTQPFQVVYVHAHSLTSTTPSSALAVLCLPAANQQSKAFCILRYDLYGLVLNPSFRAVGSASFAAATSFMHWQSIVGSSDFTAELGTNSSALLKPETVPGYQLSPDQLL